MLITGLSTALGSMRDVAGLGSMRDVAGLALLCCVWDAEPPFALPFLFPFPFKTFPLPKPSLFLLSPLSLYNPTAPWDRRKTDASITTQATKPEKITSFGGPHTG